MRNAQQLQVSCLLIGSSLVCSGSDFLLWPRFYRPYLYVCKSSLISFEWNGVYENCKFLPCLCMLIQTVLLCWTLLCSLWCVYLCMLLNCVELDRQVRGSLWVVWHNVVLLLTRTYVTSQGICNRIGKAFILHFLEEFGA